jgi:hypothetical protein
MMDQLTALKPNSLDDVIQALFFLKMPKYIQGTVSPKEYKNLFDLSQRCNEVWENRGFWDFPPPDDTGPADTF